MRLSPIDAGAAGAKDISRWGGERERAQDLIAMAQRLDPSCIELKKVHQALAQDA